MNNKIGCLSWLLFAAFLAGCGGGSSKTAADVPKTQTCGTFADWQTSNYVLPYPVGKSYFLNQSNCSGFGHSDFWQYGYDFTMDIGTEITAMRAGIVFHTQDGTPDGNRFGTNLIIIDHLDGSFALYSHLTNGGVKVDKGQSLNAGDIIALSGDTGNTGGLPHLHVSLHFCGGLPGLSGVPDQNCPTRPFNFRNTTANPTGLAARQNYTALDF